MKLSICLPTFNALDYTKKFLDTLKCTDSDYELVIIDDKSTDGTQDFLKTLSSKVIFHEENKGVSATWNELIDNSTGKYICIVNSDILLTPHWDTPLIKALERYEVVSPYHTDNELPLDFPEGNDRKSNFIPVLGCCFMFKRELTDKIGYFPEKLKIWYGDNWLSDKANCGQIYDSYVHHFVSKSATKESIDEFWLQESKDKENYNLTKI